MSDFLTEDSTDASERRPYLIRRRPTLEGETKTEMERANVFAIAPVWIVAIVEADRTDRKSVTQAKPDRVAHIIQARILRVRQKIAGVNKRRPL